MSGHTGRPPKIFLLILRRLSLYEDLFAITDDYTTEYAKIYRQHGPTKAYLWIFWNSLQAVTQYALFTMKWSTVMLRNNLKFTLRNIRRHKGYSFINIAGLALGMACCIMIVLWAQDEWSFDRFHEHADSIYRIVSKETDKEDPMYFAVNPIPLGPVLKEEYPEIIASTRFSNTDSRFLRGKDSYQERGCLADPDFLKMFSFPLIEGDPHKALSDPSSIIVTRTIARKYFGRENAMGKVLTTSEGTDFIITGILQDIPHNSHLRFNHIIPFQTLQRLGLKMDNWEDVSWLTYIMLRQDASVQAVNQKVNTCIKKHQPHDTDVNYLQPLRSIHLRSHFKFDMAGHGDIRYVAMLTFTALLILVIACINFMNLATARSARRNREVGVRKVVGASRKSLMILFFSESIILSIIAFFFAMVTAKFFLPIFNSLSGKPLDFGLASNITIYLTLAGIVLFTGMLSGSYPALLLSSFQPTKFIKGSRRSSAQGSLFRKVLVVIQFSLSITLIIGTSVVYLQVRHMRNKELGFDKDHIVFFRLTEDMRNHYTSVKTKLLQNPRILSVSGAHSLPIYESSGTSSATWEGKPADFHLQMRLQAVDADFLKTFNIGMAQGRFFAEEISTDASSAVILNETAVKEMGIENPIGKRFDLNENHKGIIIGVVKDYQLRSLHYTIEPLILIAYPDFFNFLCLKISTESVPLTLAFIKEIWKKHSPQYPFEYQFIDDAIDELYRSEERVGTIFKYFTFLAVFISCLGLFGLSAYMAEQRTKEIGIRKVFGASASKICILLSKEFVRCVLTANLIAWPVGYFVMDRWLQKFASRISIGYHLFLISGFLSLFIAALTVSYQSIRSAVANPANSLRYE
ncbi:MAG: ABC transporter permease [Candidatus Aminicenantes bacterium]|nr:ABC transporter permease [Candidatus Aminicenantes bacterium]